MTKPKELKPEDIEWLIDVSTVRTPHGEAELRRLVKYAREYRFISVHALPCWASLLKDLARIKYLSLQGSGQMQGAAWARSNRN